MSHTFHLDGTLPMKSPTTIFVYGSNTAGRHGKGSALVAVKQFGAKYGVGAGFAGQSFGIPTKDDRLRVMPIEAIQGFVNIFLDKARQFDNFQFFVTRIGCGLAGYRDDQIAPMFLGAPSNCTFAEEWRLFLDVHPAYDIKV